MIVAGFAELGRAPSEYRFVPLYREGLGVLAGGIAHDFNNILMAVIGNADLALMRLSPESSAVNNLQQIQKAAGKAADLAGQMLAYSGRGKFVVERLDLNQVIRKMTRMLEVSTSENAAMQLNLGQALPMVAADASQLRQTLVNLVTNAAEAIGDANGVITVSTGVRTCDDDFLRDPWLDEHLSGGLYVYCEVSDTGCGMDREMVKRIFEPFFSTKFTGRGLGLAAVLGIVRGHKGAIKVYSEPGKGTTVKLFLPAIAGLSAQQAGDTAVAAAWRGHGQLLLVDDEDMVLTVGTAMLEELGFEVLTAGNGREALALFREHRDLIGLVLMDLTMPDMGGEEAFHEMRQLDPAVRVIITSGYNEQEITPLFAGKGLAGFIQKPFSLSMLQDVLAAVVDREVAHE